jgi:hypothetical protein
MIINSRGIVIAQTRSNQPQVIMKMQKLQALCNKDEKWLAAVVARKVTSVQIARKRMQSLANNKLGVSNIPNK